MARQKGIFKITGTIGDVTFYKSKDGFLVREKGTLDAKRISTDPSFQRTRENGMEFGRAGKAGKTLRAALRALLINVKTTTLVPRLTAMMIKVIQADAVSVRGQRNIIDGEAELLRGFEFNELGTLSTALHAPYTSEIDRPLGTFSVEIPAFIPSEMISAPQGTTHYKISSAVADITFEKEIFQMKSDAAPIVPYNNASSVPVLHNYLLTPDSPNPLFIALGIEFYQEVNGTMYALMNGAYNALAIINVNGGV